MGEGVCPNISRASSTRVHPHPGPRMSSFHEHSGHNHDVDNDQSPVSEAGPGSSARRHQVSSSPWLWMAVACLLLGISGGIRFWREWQFAALAAENDHSPFPLGDLPRTIGNWESKAGDDGKLDDKVARIAGSKDNIVRTYLDKKSDDQNFGPCHLRAGGQGLRPLARYLLSVRRLPVGQGACGSRNLGARRERDCPLPMGDLHEEDRRGRSVSGDLPYLLLRWPVAGRRRRSLEIVPLSSLHVQSPTRTPHLGPSSEVYRPSEELLGKLVEEISRRVSRDGAGKAAEATSVSTAPEAGSSKPQDRRPRLIPPGHRSGDLRRRPSHPRMRSTRPGQRQECLRDGDRRGEARMGRMFVGPTGVRGQTARPIYERGEGSCHGQDEHAASTHDQHDQQRGYAGRGPRRPGRAGSTSPYPMPARPSPRTSGLPPRNCADRSWVDHHKILCPIRGQTSDISMHSGVPQRARREYPRLPSGQSDLQSNNTLSFGRRFNGHGVTQSTSQPSYHQAISKRLSPLRYSYYCRRPENSSSENPRQGCESSRIGIVAPDRYSWLFSVLFVQSVAFRKSQGCRSERRFSSPRSPRSLL